MRENFIAILNGLGEQLDLNEESIKNHGDAIISQFDSSYFAIHIFWGVYANSQIRYIRNPVAALPISLTNLTVALHR